MPNETMFPSPHHWHTCPGLKDTLIDHKPHGYPCHNRKCKFALRRYCGILVDAILLQNKQKQLDPRYL